MTAPTDNLASMIDHTLLAAEASKSEVLMTVSEACEHGFASVCVNGCYIAEVAERLEGTSIKPCAVAGFPLGSMKPVAKAIEATQLAKDGALEIDFVAHLPNLIAKDVQAAREEYLELVKAVRSVRSSIVVKVIIESACLMQGVDEQEAEARIAIACQAAQESGCDFIKTSTGFHKAGGASVEAVTLMRKHAGPMKVKASGGIRTTDDAKKIIDAGADRLGCSASVAIVNGAQAGATDY